MLLPPWDTFVAAFMAFIATVLLVMGLARSADEMQTRRRLRSGSSKEKLEPSRSIVSPEPSHQRLDRLTASLSTLSLPSEGWQNDAVRLKFVQAGLTGDRVVVRFYALKSVSAIVAPVILALTFYQLDGLSHLIRDAGIVLGVAGAGYYVPDLFLRMLTKKRVEAMRDVLPDVIDLLVICTESGLGLDQALNRVALEIARFSETASMELQLVTLSVRAGAERAAAMRDLALRVPLEDLSNLATMLIQADKFGTGIADALRIQAEIMRIRRMQRAEEIAAKIPTKMLLPLVFLIFPALMIVIVGPAFMRLQNVFN